MARLFLALALVGTLPLAGIGGTPGAAARGPVALTIDPRTLAASAPAAFLAGETVGLWYTRPDGAATDFGTTAARDDGRLGWTLDVAAWVAIPRDAVALVAQGWQSGQQAIYAFGPRAAAAPVALALDPRTLEASAPAAFLAGETVALWYTRPDGTATAWGTTTALADGRLDWTLDQGDFVALPLDAVTLVARGWLSGQQAVYAFPGAGSWRNTAPCVDRPGGPDAAGVAVCDGTSTWHGPLLAGATTYALTYTIDAAGVLAGTLDETFTGTAADGVPGTIHFVETIVLTPTGPDTYRVYVAATATGGTGGFCHVAGRLAFGGAYNLATGLGDGPFLGHLALPAPCR